MRLDVTREKPERPTLVSKPKSKPKPRQTLEDIEAYEGYRVDTGLTGLNRVLGTNRDGPYKGVSGLHVPSSVLLGGPQGCGKTTLILTMLSLLKERDLLFISTEQQLAEIKSSLIGIGLERYASKILAYSLLEYDCLLSSADEIIMDLDPRVVVIDSVNDLRRDEPLKDKLTERVELIRHYKAHAERHRRAIIMTAHLTRDGRIAGKQEQLHVASTTMMFTKESKTLRKLECPDKNRFGDIERRAFFEMGSKGLQEVPDPDEPLQKPTLITTKTRASGG
jgi:DNA repair protein RadA/Sms